MLNAIGMIVAINILAWLSPGPNMVLVISTALNRGRRAGIAVGAGLAFASLLWAGLAMLGVAMLFEHAPNFVVTLKLVGASYLIWLGVKLLRNAATDQEFAGFSGVTGTAKDGPFLSGFVVSMTNPNAAFFFGSVLSAFIPVNSSLSFKIFVVILCSALGFFLHGITALAFSSSSMIRFFGRARNEINLCFGIALIVLGTLVFYGILIGNSLK